MSSFHAHEYFEQFREDSDHLGYDTSTFTFPDTHASLQRLITETFEQTRENQELLRRRRIIATASLRRIIEVAQLGVTNGYSEDTCCPAAEVRLLQNISTMGNFDYAQPIAVMADDDTTTPVGIIKRFGEDTMYGLQHAVHPTLGAIQPKTFYDVGDIARNISPRPNAVPVISITALQNARVLRPATFIFPWSVRRELTPTLSDDSLDTTPALHATHKDITDSVTHKLANTALFRPYI